mmetsp:Transcript_68432/g.135213  ORF Transcript_68432/g.135213 Transcript_68432/m.135213 type:complete len:139 (+) Transcript_68432:70-486(+)
MTEPEAGKRCSAQRLAEINREMQVAMRSRDGARVRQLMAERDGTPLDTVQPAASWTPGQPVRTVVQPGIPVIAGSCELMLEGSNQACPQAAAFLCARCSRRMCQGHRRFWMNRTYCPECQAILMREGNSGIPILCVLQ